MSWYNDNSSVSRTQAEQAGKRAFERGGSEYGYPSKWPSNRQRDFSYGYRMAEEERQHEELRLEYARRLQQDEEEAERRYYEERCQEEEQEINLEEGEEP